jgi:hypothetical protein
MMFLNILIELTALDLSEFELHLARLALAGGALL